MTPKQSIEERLALLVNSAKYDASCAAGGSRSDSRPGAAPAAGGICHSWSADGRCVSLLKILLTNACIYDCAYCVNRRSNDLPRVAFTPAEVAELTVSFYRRNYIEGLFLSTGVVRSPDYTMELLIETVRLLREEHRFPGYVHLKVIPGADPLLVDAAGRYADRVSVNIELPTAASLERIAPDKNKAAILAPMRRLHEGIAAAAADRRKSAKAPGFAPAGQSTQLIVGASPESDLQILHLAAGLYRGVGLRRVYYSAFVPATSDPRLPVAESPPLLREHRLYQADWLLRFYGFAVEELLDEREPDCCPDLDPKTAWALRHLEAFPVEVNHAPLEMLLRVPGIGVRGARRIIRARRAGPLRFEELAALGVVLKRARHFITVGGRFQGGRSDDPDRLRRQLLAPGAQPQLELFTPSELFPATVQGEL